MVRGVEHIGITVEDIDAVRSFFEAAFDAEVLYEHLPAGAPPRSGEALETRLGIPAGSAMTRACMLRLGAGPGIELFEFETPAARNGTARPTDYGLQHISLYTDDIDESRRRIEAAGGELLADPTPFSTHFEGGEGNKWCYTRTPWGMTIELTTFPSPQGYEDSTEARRWRPEPPPGS